MPEIGEAAIALGSSLLNSLSALIALDWRWPELLDVEAISLPLCSSPLPRSKR